jgi:hypothetical protein
MFAKLSIFLEFAGVDIYIFYAADLFSVKNADYST